MLAPKFVTHFHYLLQGLRDSFSINACVARRFLVDLQDRYTKQNFICASEARLATSTHICNSYAPQSRIRAETLCISQNILLTCREFCAEAVFSVSSS